MPKVPKSCPATAIDLLVVRLSSNRVDRSEYKRRINGMIESPHCRNGADEMAVLENWIPSTRKREEIICDLEAVQRQARLGERLSLFCGVGAVEDGYDFCSFLGDVDAAPECVVHSEECNEEAGGVENGHVERD